MATTHLFYTIRMIWNNSCPKEFRVGKVILYSFDSFYTPEYIQSAVFHLLRELSQRDNIPDWCISEINEMIAHLRNPKLKLQRNTSKDSVPIRKKSLMSKWKYHL